MSSRIAILLPILLLSIAWAVPASGVVVKLHDGGKIIHGRLISLTGESLVIDQLYAIGDTRRREFRRAEIAELTLNVSDDRLAELDPRQPEPYFRYAEELLHVQHDPDAHYAAIRLYLIAGNLAPDQFGDQSLRRLIELARTRAEERTLRAMLHLRQADASRNARSQLSDQRSATLLDSPSVEGLLACLRALRTGDRRAAAKELKRTEVRSTLARFPGHLTVDELQSVIHGQCPMCLDGRSDCERCQATGKITAGGAQMTCPTCRGAALVQCASCRGRDYFTRPNDDQMRKLIALDLEITGQRIASEKPTSNRALPSGYRDWTRAQELKSPAMMILNWSNVTEFDPALSVYVGDRWVKP